MSLWREPLLHFLVLGALISAAMSFSHDEGRYRIDAGNEQRGRLASAYRQQYGTPPTESQLATLLDEYVRSEVLYREGLSLGLDRGDEIVRRRVIQKIEFVNQDTVAEAEPEEQRLREFFHEHQARYRQPDTVTFHQIYFSPDKAGDEEAHERAGRALKRLQANGAAAATEDDATEDDEFADGAAFSDLDCTRTAAIFGDSPLADAVFGAPLHGWSGPYRSGLGWHLVNVSVRNPGREANFEQVRERVLADMRLDDRQRRNEAEYRRLAAKYHVVRDSEPT